MRIHSASDKDADAGFTSRQLNVAGFITPEDVTHGGATKEGVDVQLLDVRIGGRTGLERKLYDHERTKMYEVLYGMKHRVSRQTCPGRLAYPGIVVRFRHNGGVAPPLRRQWGSPVLRQTCPGRLAYPGIVVRLRQGDAVRRVARPYAHDNGNDGGGGADSNVRTHRMLYDAAYTTKQRGYASMDDVGNG